MKGIAEHIAVATEHRDLTWIKNALQTAISLEHATMPPYVAATYSLKVQNFTAYNLLRSIAMEEMVHMAATCNILAAIGGVPKIKNLSPTYPSMGLPGGAEPDLYVCLAALSKPQLANFMRLEAPLGLIDPKFLGEEVPSISIFYDAIRAALLDNADAVRAAVKAGGPANQVGDNIGFSTVTWTEGADPMDGIIAAIDAITSQGEGLANCALHADGASEKEESHYARFAQVYYGRHLSEPSPGAQPTRETIEDFFRGYEIPFPVVTNTLAVPADGYDKLLAADPNRTAVEADLTHFDQGYSDLLAGLDASWNGDPAKSWPALGGAVQLMAKLRVLGCFNLMGHQVPDAAVRDLENIYPEEFAALSTYTRLDEPVFYGPRFRNLNPVT
jgi:hypothetical protein